SGEPEQTPAELMDRPLALVIEDDPLTSQRLTAEIQAAGFRVAHAQDGEEAIRKALEILPDLIVMETVLPKRDGWEVLQELRGRRSPRAWWRRASRSSGRRGCRRRSRRPRPPLPTWWCWPRPSPIGSAASRRSRPSPPWSPWAQFPQECQRRPGAPLYRVARTSPMPPCAPSRAWTSCKDEGGLVVTAGKVLIVEDNPVNLRLAQFLLEKHGFMV